MFRLQINKKLECNQNVIQKIEKNERFINRKKFFFFFLMQV